MSNIEVLESWLEPLNQAQLTSLLIDIGCAIPEAFERIRDRIKGGGRKIFVKNISFETSSETIRKYFEQYGFVEEAVIVYDRAKKKSRGYGFVTFADIASVPLALKHPIHVIDGRETETSLAVPDKEVPTSFFQPSSSYGAGTNSNPVVSQPRGYNSTPQGTHFNQSPMFNNTIGMRTVNSDQNRFHQNDTRVYNGSGVSQYSSYKGLAPSDYQQNLYGNGPSNNMSINNNLNNQSFPNSTNLNSVFLGNFSPESEMRKFLMQQVFLYQRSLPYEASPAQLDQYAFMLTQKLKSGTPPSELAIDPASIQKVPTDQIRSYNQLTDMNLTNMNAANRTRLPDSNSDHTNSTPIQSKMEELTLSSSLQSNPWTNSPHDYPKYNDSTSFMQPQWTTKQNSPDDARNGQQRSGNIVPFNSGSVNFTPKLNTPLMYPPGVVSSVDNGSVNFTPKLNTPLMYPPGVVTSVDNGGNVFTGANYNYVSANGMSNLNANSPQHEVDSTNIAP